MTRPGRAFRALGRRPAVASGTLVLIVCALLATHGTFGFAATLPVSSSRLTVLKPTALPPVCAGGSTTLIAAEDTYVDQNSATNSFGAQTTMRVTSRATTRNARVLVKFTLPSVP